MRSKSIDEIIKLKNQFGLEFEMKKLISDKKIMYENFK